VAVVFAFLGWLILGRAAVRRQEAEPAPADAPAGAAA
jgi:hypothetical protein